MTNSGRFVPSLELRWVEPDLGATVAIEHAEEFHVQMEGGCRVDAIPRLASSRSSASIRTGITAGTAAHVSSIATRGHVSSRPYVASHALPPPSPPPMHVPPDTHHARPVVPCACMRRTWGPTGQELFN